MSFFFSKQKAKPARSTPARPAQADRASKDMLNRLGCKACPLDKCNNLTPKMPPDIGERPNDVYFLGESPNGYEDERGEPFSGKAGKLLKSLLGATDSHSFDYVIRDFNDPMAKQPAPAWVAMECCRSLVTKSIEQAKPKVIVGLGIVPLQWMLNSSDMGGLRGRVFAVKVGQHACWFMPTYDPQFIMDNAFDDGDPLRSKLGHCLKFDLARAVETAETLAPPTIDTPQGARAGVQAFNGHSRTQLAQVLKLISEARKAPEKAIDLETSHLRPYAEGAKVLTAAISYGNTNFAFAVDHPKAGWLPDEKKALKASLAYTLADDTKVIAHNAPFEVEWLIHLLGRDAIFHSPWECTMMQAHFLDERRGKKGGNDDQFKPNPYQALDFLVKQYFGLSYKGLFKLDRRNMAKADLDETLVYNGADTKYTLRLYKLQRASLKARGLNAAYNSAKARQPAVALMSSLGIVVDRAQNKSIQKALKREIEDITGRIYSTPEVEAFVAERKAFNPSSGPDVLRLLKDYIRVDKKLLLNDKGKESLDKGALGRINHPFTRALEEFRNRTHMKSTYVDEFEYGKGSLIWPDGKIHPSFNTTFAETGRTSCTAHWTPVVTARGEIPIRGVRVGDLVWTHKQRWKPVTALWRKGWEVMLNLKLSNGSVLTCTKNHLLLSSDGNWVTAGEIYGRFKEVGGQTAKPLLGIRDVPQQANAFSERNSQIPRDDGSQCLVGDPQLLAQRRVQNTEALALFDVKAWGQKPHERYDRGEGAPVEGCDRRRLWLQNHKGEWKTDFLSPLRFDEGTENTNNTGRLVCASHRRQPTQQRTGQSGVGNFTGPSRNTHTAAAGFQVTFIEEIEVGRSCEVFDITVADDASYLTCGVISHNSDEPNQQNWPSRSERDKKLRKQLIAPKGHVLVAFDYGQLEACTAAMCTNDKVLVKALWEDYDIHMEWAHKAARRYPDAIGGIQNLTDKKVMKGFRGLIKNKLVFPAMFGASNNSVAGYLNMPIEPVNKLMDEFWSTFSGIYKWQKRLMGGYYENGFVESPTGRRRHYPLSKNQAINHPIQSVACDIVCEAMVTLSERAADTGNWHLHPIMNIHDDLTYVVPDDPKLLEEAIEDIYRVMLANVYPFINVPLSVSCSVGKNWLEMDEIGKFWSHKDL